MLGRCLAINAQESVSIHVNAALGAPPTGVGVTNFLSALPSGAALFVVGGVSVWWFEFF